MPTLAKRLSRARADLDAQAHLLVSRRLKAAASFLDLAVRSRALIADSYDILRRVNATLYGDRTGRVREEPNRR